MPIFSDGYPEKSTPEDDDFILIADASAAKAIKKTPFAAFIAAINALKYKPQRVLLRLDFNSTGVKTINVGFKPEKILFLGGRENGVEVATLIQPVLGLALRDGGQFAYGGVATSSGAARSDTSEIDFALLPASGGGTAYRAAVTEWTDTGFKINVKSSSTYPSIFCLVEN